MKLGLLTLMVALSIGTTSTLLAEEHSNFLEYKEKKVMSEGIDMKKFSPEQKEELKMLIEKIVVERASPTMINHDGTVTKTNQMGRDNNKKKEEKINFNVFNFYNFSIVAESATFYIVIDDSGNRKLVFKDKIDEFKKEMEEAKIYQEQQAQEALQMENMNIPNNEMTKKAINQNSEMVNTMAKIKREGQ